MPVFGALGLFLAASFGTGAPAGSLPTSFETELARLVAPAGGTAGVSVIHLETGAHAAVRGGEGFPMMSVYKLPIALALLHRVETGASRLDKRIRLEPSDLRLGRSPIADAHPEGSVALSVRELLEAMLVESDNTASDAVLAEAGGPGAVTDRLRELGVEGIRVDRPEGRLALDYVGVTDAPPESEWTLEKLRKIFAGVAPDRRAAAARAWTEDPRDTATPDAMAALLAKVARGETLNAEHTGLVLDLLSRTTPAPGRLKGRLPADTAVAHKSGMSMSADGYTGAINDVGLITLPGAAGRLAVAVFVKGSTRDPVVIDDAVARVARAAYDHALAKTDAMGGGGQ